MRQVGRDELIYMVVSAIRRVTPATWKALGDHRPEIKAKGRLEVAGEVVDAMARLEVLTSAPPASDGTFSRPLDRMAGDTSGVGSPRID